MITSSFLEVVSVGLIFPFLGVLTAPEQIFSHSLAQPVIQILSLTDSSQLAFPLTLLFVSAAIIATIFRLSLLYLVTRFSFEVGADLGLNMYRRTLYQEYLIHINRNSSEVVNSIITKTNVIINGRLIPILTLTSTAVLLFSIVSLLFVVNTEVTLISLTIFVLFYWATVQYTKERLNYNSRCVADLSTKALKTLQEGLGGIRDVLINRSQEFYCEQYRSLDMPMRRSLSSNQFISGSPRHIMDAIGMVLIASLAFFITQTGNDANSAIPVLGVIALGAQRMLPALQQSYAAYSTIKGTHASFNDVMDLLSQKLPDYANTSVESALPFEKEIWLKSISFRYSQDNPWILSNIDLKIKKGSCVGFIGTTGGGKSTLLDIVMGLLPPTKGELVVDGQTINHESVMKWRSNIAHVPQNIFLSDNTIEENIAFGVPKNEINHQMVRRVARQSQIAGLIEGGKDGYQPFVGEQGVRLSGGQRQRIGIARALYRQASILILDEATSALDYKTESEFMKVVKSLDKNLTVLIIAHRVATLDGCDRVVELSENGIVDIK